MHVTFIGTNNITEEGGIAISEALKINQILRNLNLSKTII